MSWRRQARAAGRNAGDAVGGKARQAAAKGKDLATEAGIKVGQSARAASGAVPAVPLLSLPIDATMARNAIPELSAAVKQDPRDPMRWVHLAEGLLRVRQDLRGLTVLRTAANPSSLIARSMIRVATKMGLPDSEPADVQAQRRAFAVASHRLQRNARDAAALHALARVYLSRGHARQAELFARRAVVADPDNCGMGLLTLARAHLARGHDAAAARTARRAVEAGNTLGYEVTVRVKHSGFSREDLRTAGDLLAQVDPSHRAAYHGVHAGFREVARAVRTAQTDKTRAVTSATTRRAAKVTRRLRDRAAPHPRLSEGTPEEGPAQVQDQPDPGV